MTIPESLKNFHFSKTFAKQLFQVFIGCAIFSIGAVLFVEPYGFAPGGTYGIAMILHHIFGWRTEVAATCMDIPLLIIGTIILGNQFGIKTLLANVFLPVTMFAVHMFYGYNSVIEKDILPGVAHFSEYAYPELAVICGIAFYGVGLGIVFRANATTGGSDIISMLIRKYTHVSMGTATLFIDGTIVLATLIIFGSWSIALYSALIVIGCSIVIDRVIEGTPSITMMIITSEIEAVKQVVFDELGRGATLIRAKGMYKREDRDIIYVVLSRREMVRLKTRIAKIDKRAFVNVIKSSEILGEGFKDIDQA